MDAASFSLQSSHGIMDEDKHDLRDCSFSSSSGFSSDSTDLTEDASSSASSTPSSSLSGAQLAMGPLYEMSSLMEQLPFKRGLSKHYQGKSQSFTSLANVGCLEDLARRESYNPYKKKLKSCKSYGGGLDVSQISRSLKVTSKSMSRKGSRSSWGSLLSKGNKPPIPPHKTGSFSFKESDALLFACSERCNL